MVQNHGSVGGSCAAGAHGGQPRRHRRPWRSGADVRPGTRCARASSTSASAGSTAPISPCTRTNSPSTAATGASVASACSPVTPPWLRPCTPRTRLYSLVEKGAGEPTTAVIGSIVDYRHTAGRPDDSRRAARRSDGGDRVDDDHRSRLLPRGGNRLDVRPRSPAPSSDAGRRAAAGSRSSAATTCRATATPPGGPCSAPPSPALLGWPGGSSRTARSRTRWSTASRR